MPIPGIEFDKGRNEDQIIDRIQAFLKSNKEQAFTEDEILRGLYPEHIAWPGDHIGFNSAVFLLTYAGKIESKHATSGVRTEIYYKAK